MILVLDTSAFVKLLTPEGGTGEVVAAAEEASALVASRLAYSEACGFIGRGRSQARFTAAAAQAVRSTLERYWSEMNIIELDAGLAQAAGELADRLALGGADAIHLASALRVAVASTETVVFASWDERLRAAARRERLATLPA